MATRPWARAGAWLAFLAPFFYLTYGFANQLAARRNNVPAIVFEWERWVPFVPWTIVPYWSINAFYGISLFVCASRVELGTHARRLLTAQVVAVACFILFPLRFAYPHPDTDGIPGFFFDALTSFDKPFNQAPSLHIALLVILWDLYAKHLPRPTHWFLHGWFALIGFSVLTTYQHHFIDIPTGVLLGAFCLWLWPDGGGHAFAAASLSRDRRRLVLASRYLAGGAAAAAVAIWFGGVAWWLFWVTVSLWFVAANYAMVGARGFQKDATGRMSLASRLLLAPYLFAAFINSRSWTRADPEPRPIANGVWLGRIPLASEAAAFRTVVDLCAELPGARFAGKWICVPMLDLVTPSAAQLRGAATEIERARADGPVLVCCALGYSRSAASAATWLLRHGAASAVPDAIDRVRSARPRIVIDATLREQINAAAAERE